MISRSILDPVSPTRRPRPFSRLRRITLLLGLIGFLLSQSGCAVLQKLGLPEPGVNLRNVAITALTLTHLDVRLDTLINNPYPIGLPPTGMAMDLTIEGTPLTSLSSKPIKLPASGSLPVPLNLRIKYADLLTIYQNFPAKPALGLGVDGKLAVSLKSVQKLPGIPDQIRWPFQVQKDIPALRPNIAIRSFRIMKPEFNDLRKAAPEDLARKASGFLDQLLSPGGRSPGSAAQAGLDVLDVKVRTAFDIVLTNQAAAELLFQSLNYDLKLGGENFLNGKSAQIENRGKESIVTVNSAFPINSITRGLADAINRRQSSFQLLGNAGVKIPALPDESGLKFNFDKAGNFAW